MSNPEIQIESLLRQGYQARRDRRSADARTAFTGAVDLARQDEDRPLLAQSLTGLGQILRDLGETPSALAHYQQAVSILHGLPDPLRYAHALRHVGDIARELNQLSLAQSSYEEALAIYRSHPETGTLDLANTLRGYALLLEAVGNRQKAIALWQEAGILYNKVWQEPDSPYSESDLAPGVAESRKNVERLSAV
jgi:tetratricopeptide (TPR) repeat protein